MNDTDTYDGSANAFEGERTVTWRGLPEGALVRSVTLTIAPVAAPGGILFEEQIDLRQPIDPATTFGATKVVAGQFVEVDFHKRRTLASIVGPNATGGALQIEFGGIYAEINDKGAIKSPTDTNPLTISGDGTVPGFSVAKFKLVVAAPMTVDVDGVVIRSAPANLALKFEQSATFWAYPGDLARPITTPNFAKALQAYLKTAKVEGGYYVVPFVVHSDALARLAISLDVEYVETRSAIGSGLGDVSLLYEFGAATTGPKTTLGVMLPANARVVAAASGGRAVGAFDASRIVAGYGSTLPVTLAGTAGVGPHMSRAQIVRFSNPVAASAVDLFLAPLTRSVSLRLDIRADLDGKPDGTSLLGSPVSFVLDGTASRDARWISVALAKDFQFTIPPRAASSAYWIVVQSLEGDADWLTQMPVVPHQPSLQITVDGGLSWRTAQNDALFRLRYRPASFVVPVALQIGEGAAAKQVRFDGLAPQGRVDFTLDRPEIASGIDAYLQTSPAMCSLAEHLLNGDFSHWVVVPTEPGDVRSYSNFPPSGAIAISADGRLAFVGMLQTDNAGPVAIVDALMGDTTSLAIGAAAPVASTPGVGKMSGAASNFEFAIFAASRDGRRLYAISLQNDLFVVDALALKLIGRSPGLGTWVGAADAVVSPDGSTLFIAGTEGLEAVDTASLELAIRSGTVGDIKRRKADSAMTTSTRYTAVVISPDGTWLYAARESTTEASIVVFDASSLSERGSSFGGTDIRAIALRADGVQLVVLDRGASVLTIVDTRTLGAIGNANVSVVGATSFALSVDGTRAYVVIADPAIGSVATSLSLVTIDLERLSPIGKPLTIDANRTLANASTRELRIVAAPAGNRLFIADGPGEKFTSITIGTLQPADWHANGDVRTTQFAGPAGLAIVSLANGKSKTDPKEAGLSQVVPVRAGCTYDLQFTAATTQQGQSIDGTDSSVDLFWYGGDCGSLQNESESFAAPSHQGFAHHRKRVSAPPGAEQVELRFRAGIGQMVRVSDVRFAGTRDALANGSFGTIGSDGLPVGWENAANSAGRVLVTKVTTGVRLANSGTLPAMLVQRFDVVKNDTLEIALVGHAVGAADAHATIALRYFAPDGPGDAAGASVGEATTLRLAATDFSNRRARSSVPIEASRAEIGFTIEPATSLVLEKFALYVANETAVPLSFVAEAPGELRVSAARIGFERVPVDPQPVPPRGRCIATPPGSTPGDNCQRCACGTCAAQRSSTAEKVVTLSSGRAVLTNAMTARLNPLPTRSLETGRTPIEPLALTAVFSIGSKRARALTVGGIGTVEALAAAEPDHVARLLSGLGPADAIAVIRNARSLLDTSTPPTSPGFAHPSSEGKPSGVK